MPSNDTADVFITGRQVDAVGDYVLTYTPFDDLNFDDCRWQDIVSATVAGDIDLYTGFDPDEDCYRGKVGIGIAGNKIAKLESHKFTSRDSVRVSIYGFTDIDAPLNDLTGYDDIYQGVYGLIRGNQAGYGTTTFGVHGETHAGKYPVGVYGEAYEDVSTTHSFGVRGEVTNRAQSMNQNMAVYAEVKPDPNTLTIGSNDYAFYGVGNSLFTGTPILISDESVKTDISTLDNASETLNLLNPVSYLLQSPENRSLGFETDMQYGLIAQEVQEILPELVHQTIVPEQIDSTGVIEGSSVELLGIQYSQLIPLLVAGFKEQNAEMAAQIEENNELEDQVASLTEQLQSQEEQIAEMQNQMNSMMESFQSTQSKMSNCCGNAPVEKGRSETGAIELEQNFPNPFDVETTINFTIHEPAQIRLEISDASGRVLDVLVNTQLSEGRYTERWNASAYAPGAYYYSLYADTELLTKKMIKR
ncbi:MAG: tail fiber domain-containing protein [Flavobacteriales bacterium]|nr:tail fiber domain-containing protein [Flavobacteriales bacterium]